MNIQGYQKLTLLDFPGRVACTVFTGGCNFRCPFCHNAGIVLHPDEEPFKPEEILAFLKKRQGILDGVAITGGEPLMNPDIAEFMKEIRKLGYQIKLDTNGTYPQRLKELVALGLVDYVAVDVKNSPEKYGVTVGIDNYNVNNINGTIEFLLENNVDYEFRTTVTDELHTVEDMEKLGQWIKGAKRHFIQMFKDSGELIGEGLSAVSHEKAEKMRLAVKKYVEVCEIRGE